MEETKCKPVTKYVTLKVTYNSYYVESPEIWDWNDLVSCDPGENVEVVNVSDVFVQQRLF